MDDHLRRQVPETQLQCGNVFRQFQRLHPARLPLRRQIRISQNVEEMELYTVRSGLPNVAAGLRHHLRRFPRQSQDLVDDDANADGLQTLHCRVEYRQIIPSADVCGACRMDSLKPQLHPHRLDPIQLRQQF